MKQKLLMILLENRSDKDAKEFCKKYKSFIAQIKGTPNEKPAFNDNFKIFKMEDEEAKEVVEQYRREKHEQEKLKKKKLEQLEAEVNENENDENNEESSSVIPVITEAHIKFAIPVKSKFINCTFASILCNTIK